MAFDLDGDLVYDLRTDDGSYHFVTSVAERDGTVVAASLEENDVVVLDVNRPQAPKCTAPTRLTMCRSKARLWHAWFDPIDPADWAAALVSAGRIDSPSAF
jgi:hypothetical protein